MNPALVAKVGPIRKRPYLVKNMYAIRIEVATYLEGIHRAVKILTPLAYSFDVFLIFDFLNFLIFVFLIFCFFEFLNH